MAQEVQRVRYFTGEFLQEGDFNGEQAYHIRMRYLHNRWLHTQGIATGFTVTAGPGALQVTISPGVAVAQVTEPRITEFLAEDTAKELVTITPTVLTLAGAGGAQIYIVASFAEVQAIPVASGNTRWAERPDVRALPAGSPTPDNQTTLILARVTLNGAGSGIATVDLSERRNAGMRGDIEATQLRLPVPGIANAALWPRLAGGAANRLDLTGTLNITAGNVTLAAGGTVDGRDVSTDGATLDTHVTNMALHVTNGNTHDHTGGDGAPIPFSAITAVPDVLPKAYVVANAGPPVVVLRGFGGAAAVRNAMGNYTVSWTLAVPNPVIVISLLVNLAAQPFFYHIQTISPTSVNFLVTDIAGVTIEPPRFMVVVI